MPAYGQHHQHIVVGACATETWAKNEPERPNHMAPSGYRELKLTLIQIWDKFESVNG